MPSARNSRVVVGPHALTPPPPEFVGRNPSVLRLLELAREAAITDAPILITGESGTGKEILARTIHWHSPRREHPFIAVNCGAIAGSLEESELFGYVPGAFTGANHRKQGRFEAAEGGTIFLDEIGETSPQLQVKLLRVLQDGEYNPVGAPFNSRCNVRVIAATNQNVSLAVRSGAFRADLFYRLDVVRLHMPPLRERKDDIPLLVRRFADEFGQRYASAYPSIEAGFCERLFRHDFPGNVRELCNYVHRAVISSHGAALSPAMLPPFDHDLPVAAESDPSSSVAEPPAPSEAETFHEAKKRLIEIFEREYLLSVLAECGGIIHRAAGRANLSERSFHVKLRQYGIDGAAFRAGK